MEDNDKPSPSSPPSSPLLPPPAPDPPQPQPSPAASKPPSSPDVKPNLELVPVGTPDFNSNPNSTTNPPKSPAKKNPPLPWTHQETVSLIQAYQEKWYSLKKGQLKANQWEDVSATVAARCGFEVPSKTSTQCRHKIEKLRKRYRAELLKPYPNSWQYFELMDHMERGPMAIPLRSVPAVKYPKQRNASAAAVTGNYRETESGDGEGNLGAALELKKNKLKSINNIVRGGHLDSNRSMNRFGISGNFGFGEDIKVSRGLRTPMIQKRKAYFRNDETDEDEEDDDDEDDDEGEELEEKEHEVEEKGRGRVIGKELANEIRGFAERFMRMESKKIEMMKETERYRMEMEQKRMQMIIEAQRKVVDTIGRALGAHKKVKMMAQEN